MIDGALLGQDDRRDGFELDELLGSPTTSPTSGTLDMRQYDERDYQCIYNSFPLFCFMSSFIDLENMYKENA
jgi:hypothetical protein